MGQGNYRSGGCGRKGDKVVSIADFRGELERIAKDAKPRQIVWNNYPMARTIVEDYYGKVPGVSLVKMLKHVYPGVAWSTGKVEKYAARCRGNGSLEI